VLNVTDELDGKTILIPRTEIQEILERYNDWWRLDHDPSADVVRRVAADLRAGPEHKDHTEAAELDALVDRIEAGQ
jgi:hypothetical protein